MNSELGKVCVISNDYPSKGCPVYVFVEQLVNALIDSGEDISVVAPQSITKCLFQRIPIRPRKQKYVTDKGNVYMVFRPYILTFGKRRRWLCQMVCYINNRWSVDKVLKNIAPDILYAHFWENAIRIMDCSIKENLPVFVACGEGDNAMEDMLMSLPVCEKERLKRSVKGVVSVSTENKRKCIDYGLASEQDIIVIPNAVDCRLFHPMRKNTDLRKKLGVADDDFLLLFVGGFIQRKGSGILAKAIDSLNDPHVKVIFVGATLPGDEDDPQCEGIVFKGRVPHEKLPEYYACADVFVLPTQKEGCSNAIVEALAIGLPVISSEGSFNDDILNDNNSLRVNPVNVDDVAVAIAKLRDDKRLRHDLAEGALISAKDLKIEKRAEKIIHFINQRIEF